MKKKGIIIVVAILLGGIILTIVVRRNTPKYILQNGMMLALTLDENEITTFPERGKYNVEIDCRNSGDGIWLVEDWKLAIEDIKGNVKCTVKFTSNPPILIDEVENKATEILPAGKISSSATYTVLEFSGYSNITNNSTYPFAWDEDSGYWIQTATEAQADSFFKYELTEPGGYKICYKLPSSTDTSGSYLNKNNINIYLNSTSSSETSVYSNNSNGAVKTDCYDLGYLTTEDYIYIKGHYYDNNISFNIQKTEDFVAYDVGYRYTGKTPNNWIWFNGEKWRIIGSMPAKQSDGTTSNLVKIIRNTPIGNLVFDNNDSSNEQWGSNILYTLLNTKYYGKLDASGTSLCFLDDTYSGTDIYSKCDYRQIGISSDSTDYYGRMLKSVYWNIGNVYDVWFGIRKSYTLESDKKSSVSGRVGLMNATDFGFANSGVSYTSKDIYYASSSNNWLSTYSSEYTITTYQGYALYTVPGMGRVYTYNAYGVRPVVFLDPSVYVISGDGTEENPYQIGM